MCIHIMHSLRLSGMASSSASVGFEITGEFFEVLSWKLSDVAPLIACMSR